MRLDDSDLELTRSIADETDMNFSQGKPEKGHKSSIDEEQWRDSIAEATIREAFREVSTAYANVDNRDDEPHPKELFDQENIDTIYFTQRPWRCPFMAIDLEECPDWAQITITKEAKVRTHDAHPCDDTAIRFQVREGL